MEVLVAFKGDGTSACGAMVIDGGYDIMTLMGIGVGG